ncbi:ATP-dependent RNA helicase HrpB [Leclercia adecarboxylata]|uniref:ATP-dependent RNA helicase HrpB n=1 Tax=Leclercia adecarboxylata TaxID=83655 RepID=A0A4U9HK91_9ENTR|nr:ATP-dependent RNA helicase HrpB [Leclercia adecarboxylata]
MKASGWWWIRPQERVANFDPRTGLTRLVTQRVSQASMTQRAGRAGRLEPGICLHLTPFEQAERAAAQGTPEILQSDLSGLLMELLQWGCRDPAQLSWLDLPPATNLAAARRLLTQLGGAGGGATYRSRAEDGEARQRSTAGGNAGQRLG